MMDHVQTARLADSPVSIWEHISELRRRLIWSLCSIVACFIFCYHFSDRIYDFVAEPLTALLRREGDHPQLIFTALSEAFFTYIRLSIFSSVFISIPFVLLQVWMFVSPGLYPKEKRAFATLLISVPLFFLLGAALAYFVVLPLAWKFFLSFQAAGGPDGTQIQLQAKISEYLSLVMQIVTAFGAAFELPVILSALCYLGLIKGSHLRRFRRYACVGSFAIAAIITPPDVITQVSLAVPLMLLYEVSILASGVIERAADNR
ncbi:twin-arginine translocase subunit TatC [Komagataeibacter diospyri]|uniref:twin-arginine translocase subunit TatC n=1 Tax=Komagataeibacter diospyri TaxID=1932662 RepID=UPI0037574F43